MKGYAILILGRDTNKVVVVVVVESCLQEMFTRVCVFSR